MKIRSKLLSSFSILILLSILLGFISYKTIKDLSNEMNPVIELNNAVNMHMLQLRRNEKDFLARSLIDESYFDSGKSKYLNQFESLYSMVKEEISSLDHFSHKDDYHAKMAEMQGLISDYKAQFMAVVEKKTERGFKNWGLIGELRTSVHNIEDKLQKSITTNKNELLVTLLMCRRHEKDYLLRNDAKYQKVLSDRVDLFINQVKSTDLNTSQQSELIRLISDYRNKFNDVVAIDEEIGRSSSDGLMGSYRETIHQLEPLVAKQDTALKQEVGELVEKSSLTLLALVIFIALLGVFLALFLSSIITKPLVNMTNAGKKISAGDLSAEVPTIKTNDEIKEMGDTMNLLISAIKFHLKR